MRVESPDPGTTPSLPANVHDEAASAGTGGWLSEELWQERIDRIRAQYARDDENALLNATLKL